MNEIVSLLLIFVIWVVWSVIWAISSWAALFTVPWLIMMWIPASVAVATWKVGALWLRIGSFFNYNKSDYIVWKLVLPITILSIFWTFIWSFALISLPENLLNKLVWIILVVIIPIVFLKSDIWEKSVDVSKKSIYIWHFFQFLVQIWKWFFSPWSWVFSNLSNMKFYWMSILQSKWTTKIPNMIWDIISICVYLYWSLINWKYWIILFVWMFIWSYLGSLLAIKKWDEWVKQISLVFIVLVGLKMIFF
jgi:uncharacterized membrane protein YfcA